mmetsp:Transcript_24040/g.58818  ORF Transcript_24040/g.58818 Transcript_24040/m.58818 type:complete len:195 (+) Transcript_24040:1803-2387(+)
MDLQKTEPSLKRALLTILNGVRDPSIPSEQSLLPSLRPAFRSQMLIGCQGLLEGRLSTHWAVLQQQYLHRIGSRRSSRLWASRLTQQLILIGFYMWEHRNSVRHSDDNVNYRECSRQVNERIHSQFDMGTDDLQVQTRPMLNRTRQSVLQKTLVDREEWVKMLTSECRRHRRALAPQHKLLYDFLHPDAPNHDP